MKLFSIPVLVLVCSLFSVTAKGEPNAEFQCLAPDISAAVVDRGSIVLLIERISSEYRYTFDKKYFVNGMDSLDSLDNEHTNNVFRDCFSEPKPQLFINCDPKKKHCVCKDGLIQWCDVLADICTTSGGDMVGKTCTWKAKPVVDLAGAFAANDAQKIRLEFNQAIREQIDALTPFVDNTQSFDFALPASGPLEDCSASATDCPKGQSAECSITGNGACGSGKKAAACYKADSEGNQVGKGEVVKCH